VVQINQHAFYVQNTMQHVSKCTMYSCCYPTRQFHCNFWCTVTLVRTKQLLSVYLSIACLRQIPGKTFLQSWENRGFSCKQERGKHVWQSECFLSSVMHQTMTTTSRTMRTITTPSMRTSAHYEDESRFRLVPKIHCFIKLDDDDYYYYNYYDHFYSTKECQTILGLDRRDRRQINTYR